ncbi:monosaccharide ABC transporter ATP-binding protein (CUT2 family) [Rhodobacter aestuarii]|uniref:Monosaccharide ABC transporter ATP-binding protein, CUT2 family n=1 Tax=Rhodobacter aestuarii TaxID=453582 RepID=A0A1N7PN40_9RHOB|nr:sugar ABC transporter ATP-binding protein [Rhodobacter aestuarii]PTV94284.1 monosaccharide ABC transporter ATP-binding protein (CUT2 family) [Rhodobacter aestuarii]SIT11930.1 monosaccharide ABC transporter ATP-binding protein, CUT2 family [Rhodobacter aestuarii]
MTSGSDGFALRLKGITKIFGGVKALDAVDFEVRAGEVHCLAGENGCGKSTLIKVVTGVYTPESAEEISLFGEAVSTITPVKARAKGVSVIWQDLALFPNMSVAENIAFDTLVGARPRGVPFAKMKAAAAEVLARLGVTLDLDAPLETLPIAQRQVVAIARALLNDARLIFMDEPTASLTQSETDRLLEIVRKLSADGVAVVFVSHRLAEVLDISSRVTVLRDGKLVGVYPTEGMTQARLGELMTGHLLESNVSARDVSGPVVFEAKGLSVPGQFENIDLTIRAGEVVGLTGLIGAGRTELAHAMIGMTRAQGTMRLMGKPYIPGSLRDAIAQGLAYVSEDRLSLGLLQKQSIADNAAISVLPKLLDQFGLISPAKKQALILDWVKRLGIKIGAPENPIATLSGGNQQKVVLAKWLATEPKLLILDSPTVGVDVGARAGIFRIVRDLADQGLAILLISDEASEVLYNADRVLHMAEGRIRESFDPRQTTIQALEAAIYA